MYPLGRAEGVKKNCTLCTLAKLLTIMNDPIHIIAIINTCAKATLVEGHAHNSESDLRIPDVYETCIKQIGIPEKPT